MDLKGYGLNKMGWGNVRYGITLFRQDIYATDYYPFYR